MFLKFIAVRSWGIMCCLYLLLRALALAESSSPAKCDPKMKVQLNYPPSSEGWERSRELNRLSLSAWQWTRTIVKNGIPEVIYEAVCDSAYCDYPLRDSDALEGFIAVPIHQVLLVLQRQTGRSKCYVAHYRRVAVGCTCVWAKTSTNINTE